MLWFPSEPAIPWTQRAHGDVPLRYEDVCQDGRLMIFGLPHATGVVIWQKLLAHHALASVARQGIIPVLTRFVIEAGDGPFSVRWPLEADGCYQLARAQPKGHLMLNLWLSAKAPRGRTHGPPPDRAGEPAFAGRVYVEHVFTRPFAPPADRKVTQFSVSGLAPLPADECGWRPPEAALELPPDAQPIDADFVSDDIAHTFGLMHTDSNQHVNSLVYPRLFNESVLRRLQALGRSPKVLARRVEIAYRKPCFAGDRVRFRLRLYEAGTALGAVGALFPDGDTAAKPYCFVHLVSA
jgi:hypothetical protein